uniref:Uncharacterized protein n=1 Tax=Anopheles culicifacies TaxID=139723 RepID=A0A182MDL2_9DIPT
MNSSSSTLGIFSILSKLSLLKVSTAVVGSERLLFRLTDEALDSAPEELAVVALGLISMIFELVVTGVEGMMFSGRLTGLRIYRGTAPEQGAHLECLVCAERFIAGVERGDVIIVVGKLFHQITLLEVSVAIQLALQFAHRWTGCGQIWLSPRMSLG